MKNREFNLLLDIRTNKLNQLHLIIPKKLTLKRINGLDYIYFTGNSERVGKKIITEQLHSDASALIALLEIGYFIHEEMVKDFQNFFVYSKNGTIIKSDKYPILVEKVFKFCTTFGIEFDSKPYDSDGKLIPRVQINNYLQQSSKLYLWYRDFKLKTEHLSFMTQYDTILSLELRARVFIEPVISSSRVVELRYSFESIFDVTDYQFLLYLRGVQEFNIGLCPYCHVFFRRNRNQKYCTTSHGDYDRRRLKDSVSEISKTYEKIKYCKLESCGKPFIPTNQKQLYCPGGKCKKIADNLAAKRKIESMSK